MNQTASAFFVKHRELFEFDKHVGTSSIPSATTPSFLDQYRECEQRQTLECARQPFLVVPTATIDLLFHQTNISSVPPQVSTLLPPARPTHMKDPTSTHDTRTLHSIAPSSPTRLLAAVNTHQPVSPSRRSASPTRVDRQPPVFSYLPAEQPMTERRPHQHNHQSPIQLPKLSDLLIDATTRASSLATKRMDDAKKIELLIGSKCVGRISAASTNVPPAIRRRLQAAHTLHRRREELYTLLSDEYHRLVTF